ncbi:mitochondrial protein from FMP27-domain-containing protein [Dichotomopilus funicola]|uniref:COP9 signalosome complex subunit 5 n=1 Tax=Dichotomopilus funicola TaxID=1934379 RepID=A0AAN6V8U8_9PEZI|nr:mitochondrial protein from FMP27-domain-containing protein [Dichotomopilus funicola]
MALLNPTFIFGILVLLYLSTFVVFAVVRIVTGVSIQRIGYFSLRRLAYTARDGVRFEVRGLGLNVHRPTFAQPTWLSIVVDEFAVTVNIKELERARAKEAAPEDVDSDSDVPDQAPRPITPQRPRTPRLVRRGNDSDERSKTWKRLTRVKERIKRLHRKVNWLRMVDVVATNSTVNIAGVGNVQMGSFTVAVDTRRKMVDRARFFLQGGARKRRENQQAEWIVTLRSVLFTAEGGESTEVLDSATLNIHGYLYDALDGLRDAAIALKLGRVHIPYDDVRHSLAQYKRIRSTDDAAFAQADPVDVVVDRVIQELDVPGSTNQELMQTVSDSKELVSSVLKGIREVQFAVSFIGLTKKIEAIKPAGQPIILTASMKEVGIDLHRLDPKSAAHRMYFPSKDIAHEALAAALSISVGLDDGHGKPERIMYIPMATTTARTTLPSKTVELADQGTAEQRNANILFANSVVTSPSVDLDPRHLPLLIAMLQRKPKAQKPAQQQRHMLISRLLPKATYKFSMHEPVLRISLPPVQKTAEPDEFDLIISSISSISLDIESFHSTVEDLHYSLAAAMRVQTHNLYYQTSAGSRFDLLETESFDLKVQLNATPNVHVVVTGNLETFTLKMVREEIRDGLRQIVRQLRLNVEPDKRAVSKTSKHSNFLRGLPAWLLHFQLHCSDCSIEVAGVDKGISEDSRGIVIQLDSWSADYRSQRLDGLHRRPSRRRASSRGVMSPENDILKAIPVSPRKKYYHEGDGRRVALHARGFEVFMVEAADKWEFEPFVNIPKFEVALSTLSDHQGPVFHIHSHIRTVLLHYSLSRHYAVGVAVSSLRKAFMRTSKDGSTTHTATAATTPMTPPMSPQGRRVVGHLSPPTMGISGDLSLDAEAWKNAPELVAVDFKATLIQIKADLPSDPPVMFHIYNLEAGQHRWSSPFVQAKLVRLFAEAPRMRRVWARVVSLKNVRVDHRESRHRLTNGGVREDRMFDIVAENVRLAVPHEMVIYKITDNFVNTLKSVLQLHHRFKTGTDEYILDKGPEPPKKVPKVSLRAKSLLFELEDGAFEWKLGVIYRAGMVETMQRQAREEAFRVKVKKIHEQESRRGLSSKRRARSAARQDDDAPLLTTGGVPRPGTRSHSAGGGDGRRRSASDGRMRGRTPRYDPEAGARSLNGQARVSIAEARHKLNLHNAKSWKQRIDQQYELARRAAQDMRSHFWGVNEIPDDLEDSEKVLEVPQRPALMAALINDLHIVVDKPSFPLRDLPDFLHKVSMGEARISLRDYPLPFLHVPAIKPGQSVRLPALAMTTDFVIAEEYRGPESTRRIRVPIVPPSSGEEGKGAGSNGFAVDVRRTIGPVKTFSDMSIDIHTANPTRITWGPSYQPAIQDMMMAIESMTKPQLDPSDRVGFWDKIRLNFHSRIRVAWRGDGDVHLALKGSRDPYQVTGNGAGFLMCFRNDVRWNIHTVDDPKEFMTVDSGEYVMAVPDYSHQVREARRQHGEDDGVGSIGSRSSGSSMQFGSESKKSGAATFKKVVMKLSGKVQWLAGLVFERAIGEDGTRTFACKPHYEVMLKSPAHAKPGPDGLPYDAFRGFRSQHIHLSVAIRAPVDRAWSGSGSGAESGLGTSTMALEPSRSYNAVHLTPRFFTHFFAWWSLFSGPLSLPIRQGSLWPGREKNSKKFGRHLATIKYNILLAPLFVSHIYKHKDAEYSAAPSAATAAENSANTGGNAVSATGIKVRLDSFMLDLHQRREEFNTRDRGRKTQSRTTGMKIHAGQLDLVSADVRAVSASIRGSASMAASGLFPEGQEDGDDEEHDHDEDPPDLSRFTIPDNDLTWIDMDDFVELDWILPTEEPNPDTKILPLAFAPRVTYFRQTDINGTIAGDPDRTSPFGQEPTPTHVCVMSQDDDPRNVQCQLIRRRLEQLDEQIETHQRNLGHVELRLVRGDADVVNDDGETAGELDAEFEMLSRHSGVLAGKKMFLQGMLAEMTPGSGSGNDKSTSRDEEKNSPTEFREGTRSLQGTMSTPAAAEFASDFKNRFVVHNMQLKWNNTLRNIILRYSHQVGQRRGFVYYLSRPAVKFILDLVDEQAKSKVGGRNNSSSNVPTPGTTGHTPDFAGQSDQDVAKDIEDRIRRILQDSNKFAGQQHPTMADLASGIADEFTTQNSYHVRLIAPQIQLQSDKNKKHVVLTASKGMELKVVDVLDKSRLFDDVSGLVQRRFLVNMDSTQFFVTHQKWFSTQLVSMYSGNTYGTPAGSSWPPWVPMEVMFDFQSDPFGFKRVVQKTSAMLRYDKFNPLRLKYNDEVNASAEEEEGGDDGFNGPDDNLWVEFPRAHALCNSSQYYAIYVIVLDLLMYSEPLEKTRSERLEKILLASDFSDLRGVPEMVIRLQERVRQLEEIKTHFHIHARHLDQQGWHDRLLLERDLAACEDELFFMMTAITSSQQRRLETGSSNALLKWSIMAKEIVWQLVRDNNEPMVELQLKDVEYDRIDNADGSHINLMQVGKILGLNLLPDAIYPTMVAPYVDRDRDRGASDRVTHTNTQPVIRVYWNMLEAIAGIPVMDHFEVNLFPLKIQLERELGKKLFEYIFPGTDVGKATAGGGSGSGKNDSPFMIRQSTGDEEDDENETEDEDEDDNSTSSNATPFATRPGSLELRLRPTLTSDPDEGSGSGKHKALTIQSGEGVSFRLFRSSNTGPSRSINKKRSHDSLRINTPRPGGFGRTTTGLSALSTSRDAASIHSDTASIAASSTTKSRSRFTLRHRSNDSDKDRDREKDKDRAKDKSKTQSDDLTKMMDRASNYMTFAYIKMPSVVLCLSYKGKGDRNFEDVHDFVFRLPTIEYRNKTWSNLDLALALKSRVIKALISHTGAIIGNKFSRHRPNTAQQSKLRELATSSVLLATPPTTATTANSMNLTASESRDNSGDDSSSLYGVSPVDFSRSPPRSIRRSQTSIPIPSPSASRSSKNNNSTTNTSTTSNSNASSGSGSKSTFSSLLRPSSSGWSRTFGGGSSSSSSNNHGGRPSSSSGVTSSTVTGGSGSGSGSGSVGGLRRTKTNATAGHVAISETDEREQQQQQQQQSSPDRRRTGGSGTGNGGDRIQALANRLKERENTVVAPVASGGDNNMGDSEDGDGDNKEDGNGNGNGLVRRMKLPLTDKLVDRQRDALFNYSATSQAEASKARPWTTDPHYFKTVRISPVALIKMVIHARSGGAFEVMGIMQGYVDGPALVVTDAFRLPVEGTETRVNAQGEADEYLVEYLAQCRDESRQENVIGWYHSHPGYGCWLSGIDVATQQLQQLQGPMVAVVIDPDRTVSANKVDIGAFRTYPDGYIAPAGGTSAASQSSAAPAHDPNQTAVPLTKAGDYGAHASKYYPLAVEHFRSTLDGRLLDRLWDKYWVQTLSQNPLLTNRSFARSQMADAASRVHDVAGAIARASRNASALAGGPFGRGGPGLAGVGSSLGGPGASGSGAVGSGSGGAGSGGVVAASDAAVSKIVQDIDSIAARERAGLVAADVKTRIFSDGSA